MLLGNHGDFDSSLLLTTVQVLCWSACSGCEILAFGVVPWLCAWPHRVELSCRVKEVNN